MSVYSGNPLTNAVVAWNTVHMAAVIEQLQAEGYSVRDEDIAHLSPARFEHLNPYGKYLFDLTHFPTKAYDPCANRDGKSDVFRPFAIATPYWIAEWLSSHTRVNGTPLIVFHLFLDCSVML
jgi:Tn3 transposase DDE domain